MRAAIRELWGQLVSSFRASTLDRELADELAVHLEMAERDFLRQGHSPSEARRLARIQLGGIEQAKERHRDSRGLPWLDGLWQDVRYAGRTLRKNPGFAAVAVAMLALGIGINAIVFTVADTVLFKGFPLVERNDRLLYMTSGRGCCVSYPDFEDWRTQATSFAGMALVHGLQQTYSDEGGFPETVYSTEVTANTFRLVGQEPILGRDFTTADETPGAPPVAIIRHSLWESRYSKDPSIIGRRIRINGTPTVVIGVMPRGFSFPQNQDFWLPLVPTTDVRRRDNRETWFVLGRLADGVTVATARAEIETIGRRLATAYPATNDPAPPLVHTFDEFFIGPRATMIYKAMWAAVTLVLLIAGANVANLLLARAIGRSREMSVRIAMGASRSRIVRQLLVESVMLSCAGGLVAWWIANLGLRIFTLTATGASLSDQINGTWFNGMLDYSLDSRAFGYLLAISAGTGLLFGLAPASRLSTLDVHAALKDGSRGATDGGRRTRLSSLLVVAEMALAVVLLTGAGVMLRSFLNIYTVQLGFNADNIVATLVHLPAERYPSTASQQTFYDRLKVSLESIPGVQSAAMGALPSGGSGRRPYELAGAAPVTEARRPTLFAVTIGTDYFKTIDVSVRAGREFNDDDRPSSLPVIIVNEQFANRHWPGENPLGKRLRLFRGQDAGPWLTVVGLAATIAQNDPLQPEQNAVVYLPHQQQGRGGLWALVRAPATIGSLSEPIRRAVQSIDPLLPIQIGPSRLPERFSDRYQYRGVSGALFLLCAVIALLLASIGLYAVVAHSVNQRRQEIGIRIAIGGTGRDILALVFRSGLRPLLLGLGVGMTAAYLLMPALKSVLIQVSPADPLTFTVASLVLIAAALLGCWIPARRAMRVDPVIALRA
jgi:putative ABC transport system permease protein